MENKKVMDLEIRDVSKSFETKNGSIQALSPVNMTIENGTFVTILGPSGCGKSTLIRIIAGLETPTTGEVLIGGKKIEGADADRGMVFQNYTLFPWLNVEQNIAFGLEIKGTPKAEIKDKVDNYLEMIGLKNFRYHYPEQLSGGMKQRAAIARALINDPNILLMDEPFGALDAQTRIIMQEVLQNIWQETKKTVIFITHDVDEAVFLGDKVYVMTAMPGTMKHMEPIEFPRPREFQLKMELDFMKKSSKLLEMIREESYKVL